MPDPNSPRAGPRRLMVILPPNAAGSARSLDSGPRDGESRIGATAATARYLIGPAGITPRASYDAPRLLASGVDLVLVNGVPVWRGGRPLPGRTPGRLVDEG